MRDIFLHLHKSEKGLYYSFSMDLVSDRLFRHLAWANTYVFDRIAEQPEAHLQLTAPNDT